MSRFSPRFEIFELKEDETIGIRQVVDYSIKSKGYFGKGQVKRGVFGQVWSFLKAEF
jgi:hypothetical protein